MVYSLSYSRGGRRGRRLPSPDMPLNSPKHPPYWNSASGFDFDLVTAVDMSFYTSLQNFIYIGPPSAEKMTSCRFSRWRISAILDFRGPVMGSLRSPCTTSYRSSIETITLNCLVFEKIAFSAFWRQTDRQTDRQTNKLTNKQMNSSNALSRSRCHEQRLNEMSYFLYYEIVHTVIIKHN